MKRALISLLVLCLASVAQAQGRGADGDFDVRTSAHFILHQDVDIDESGGFHGSRRFEQELLGVLESAYDSLDQLLDLRPERKLHVVVYDPGIFDREFAGRFRFPAAGFYQGVIRIRGATQLSVGLQRVLHHELVHAALDAAAPSIIFPGWLNEGGAEWFEARALGKRGLNSREWGALRQWSKQGALFSIDQLSVRTFVHMGPNQAQRAYLQAYALVEYLARTHGERELARFYAEFIRTRDLSRALKRAYRMDLRDFERRFFDQLN